jgi:hypothetical protein
VLHAAFCLPLDFVSQAVVTAVFFVIHYPANCPQVAYVFQLLLQHAPPLLLLQQGVESTITAAGNLLQPFTLWGPAAVAAASTDTAAAAAAECAAAASSIDPLIQLLQPLNVWSPGPTAQSIAETCTVSCPAAAAAPISVGSMLFDPPQAAVDLHTVAGRWIFASSTAYMLFAVLLVPLYVSWRLERHLKSKWMATLPDVQLQQALLQQQQQQQQVGRETDQSRDAAVDAADIAAGAAAAAAGSGNSPAADANGDPAGSSSTGCASQQQQQQSRPSQGRLLQLLLCPWRGYASSSSSSSSMRTERFVYPPVVYDALPASDTLLRHLAVLWAVSGAAAQLFVQLCRLAPCLVKQVMWPQIVFK